jgi:hypothetical protein
VEFPLSSSVTDSEQFFWNEHIAAPFIDAGQHSFVLPVMQGFVGQRPFTIKVKDDNSKSAVIDPSATPDDIQLQSWHEKQKEEAGAEPDTKTDPPTQEPSNGKDFLLTLVSRRSTKRAGLRYLRRGTDDEGCAANSVETEQILSSPTWNTSQDKIFSYTQFRGSIPLFFSQSPYSLKPQVSTWGTFQTNARAFKRHMTDLSSRYGDIYCASLVDKHGTEAKIGELYEKHAKDLNENGGLDGQGKQLGFEWFDFHNVCRGMHFENVSRLMDTLEPFATATGWTIIANDQIQHKQSGVLRTNCMDCLDRTNVVQSMIGRFILSRMLVDLGLMRAGESAEEDKAFEFLFRNVWADNADVVSKSYSGTGALKTDFTRLGVRTKGGALQDLNNSITRYCLNNFSDGPRQDAFDLFLGTYLPSDSAIGGQLLFVDRRPIFIQAIPYILAASMFLILVGSFTRRAPDAAVWPLRLLLVLSLATAGACLNFMWSNGTLYVSPLYLRLSKVYYILTTTCRSTGRSSTASPTRSKPTNPASQKCRTTPSWARW